MIAPNVLALWITGAPTTVNARTGCSATGIVSVKRASMEQPARCVNLGDMEKTASQVTSKGNFLFYCLSGGIFKQTLVKLWFSFGRMSLCTWQMFGRNGGKWAMHLFQRLEGSELLCWSVFKSNCNILCLITYFLP